MSYQDFLKSKVALAEVRGVDVARDQLNPALFEFQKDVTIWALRGGSRAIFASFGMGKTFIQVQLLVSHLSKRPGACGLIVCPLGVRGEFKRDAKKFFGIDFIYVRNDAELEAQAALGHRFFITNYERVRDGDLNPNHFLVVSLDEAAVLRSFGSKTYQTFLTLFGDVQFKYVCTATPSPNRFKELIHYAGFLGIMDTGQALTRFFKRDSSTAGNLTIHPHKEREFWLWVSSWATFLTKPSDLGYPDDGYDLPPLNIIRHRLPVDHTSAGYDSWGQGKLLRDAAISLREASRERRESIDVRILKARQIIDEADLCQACAGKGEITKPAKNGGKLSSFAVCKTCKGQGKVSEERHWLIWHELEAERAAIETVIPEATTVWGSQNMDEREVAIEDFSEGRCTILATKPSIAGSGCNFQRFCYSAIFVGVGYRFADFIQAIHRIQRFLQPHEVEIHLIYMESEDVIHDTLMAKWKQHNVLVENMTKIIKECGLNNAKQEMQMQRAIGLERQSAMGGTWTAANNDNVLEMERFEENSVDLVVSSWPFSNHYEYVASYNDFGHNDDDDRFFEQMDFLTPLVLRALKPGRMYCVHCKDRLLYGSVSGLGMYSVNPFSDKCVAHLRKHGLIYCGRIFIDTDVVRENSQTYRLGWSENAKDGTKMGVGSPEYIVLFRKLPTDLQNAYADEPVPKAKPLLDESGMMLPNTGYSRARWQYDASAFWRSRGDRFLTPEEIVETPLDSLRALWRQWASANVYDFEKHVQVAELLESKGLLPASFMALQPVAHSPWAWDDIVRMRTLNTDQARRRVEGHVCPLQFDVVERLINRYSQPGDLVLDPFAGLMTVPFCALKLGRRGYGIELSSEYWADGVGYLRAMEQKMRMPTLFDLVDLEAVSAT